MTDQAAKLREMMQNRANPSGSKSHKVEKTSTGKPVKKHTRIITIASGKGGVGKTNLSTNIALSYASMGKKVVLMDADLGLANVNVVMGIVPKYNLYHLMRKQKTINDILMDTEYGIQIIAGASGFFKIANLTVDERKAVIQELQSLADVELIIVDTGAGVSSNVLSFIAASDEAIIITTPEPTAITDAYGIIKVVATEVDNLDLNLKLIVNRVKSVTEGKRVAERVINIAGQFLNLKIHYLGCVYDDQTVGRAVLKQKPFMIVDPKCKAATCVHQITGRLERTEYREGRGVGQFFKRLMGRL